MTLISSGCSATLNRLNKSATIQGELRAGINLPDQPVSCKTKEPHAKLVQGRDTRIILDEERAALERQHAWQDLCLKYNQDLKIKLQK